MTQDILDMLKTSIKEAGIDNEDGSELKKYLYSVTSDVLLVLVNAMQHDLALLSRDSNTPFNVGMKQVVKGYLYNLELAKNRVDKKIAKIK